MTADEHARVCAFQEAQNNPYGYLAMHYSLNPDSKREDVLERFNTFAAATGVSAASVAEAVDAFFAGLQLPEFVLQAASGKVAFDALS